MADYRLRVDDIYHDFNLSDCKLAFCTDHEENKEEILLEDVLAVKEIEAPDNNWEIVIYYIKNGADYKWTKEELTVSGDLEIQQMFLNDIRQKLEKANKQRPKRLLVVLNPISGKRQSENTYEEQVAPLFKLANIETIVKVSTTPGNTVDIIREFDCNTVDGIVLCGGDGTYNEGMNTILRKTQELAGIDFDNCDVDFVPTKTTIGIIPTGTGNVMSRMFYGCRDIQTATLHIIKGFKKTMPVIATYSMGKYISSGAIVMCYGCDAHLYKYVENFRWMGIYRYLVIPVCYYVIKTISKFGANIDITERFRDEDGNFKEKIDHFSEKELLSVSYRFDNILNEECNITTEQWNPNNLQMVIYRPCYQYRLIKRHIDRIFRRPSYNLPQDYIERYRPCKFKMKCDHYGSKDDYTVLLDSEFIKLEQPELDVRVHSPIVSVFSSL